MTPPRPPLPTAARVPIALRVALAAAVFAIIWGAKLSVIAQFGSDLPFWDQWDREGDRLYVPWLERGERFAPLLAPHNEHRIVPTLALNLGLALAGGQWDARVQCVASAALHAAILTALFLWSSRRFAPPWALGSGLLLAALGAAPIAWENVLSGFQSQFYFLSGFSLLALGGLLAHPPFTARWWAGLAAGGCALVSMGSGLLCALPVLAITLLRFRDRERPHRELWPTLVAATLLLLAGVSLHTSVPAHAALRAPSISAFIAYFLRCLSWPLISHPWPGLLVWAPWLALLALRFRPRPSLGSASARPASTDFTLALGLWVLAQIAAVSFSRGGGGDAPASRYGDVFAFGVIASFFALASLAAQGPRSRVLGGAWALAVAVSLALATRAAFQTALPNKRADHAAFEFNVHQFVLTDDVTTLENKVIPFPNVEWLVRVLRRPVIREILPASVRAPLPLAGFAPAATHFPPPAPHRPIHALEQPAEWRSGPLPARPGWWKIEVAGRLGEPGTALELVAAHGSRPLRQIVPPVAPSTSAGWRTVYFRAPRESASLVARTDSTERPFAVSEPVFVSSLSYRVTQLAAHGHWLALPGLATFLLAAGLALVPQLRQPQRSQSS